MYSLSQIRQRLEVLNYKFFDSGEYNLNIIGVRNKVLDTNTFNDDLYLIFKKGGEWQLNIYKITTDPGFKSLTDPVNDKGTAILVPGQYRSAFILGKHKGKYEALVQYKPLKVYRDNNLDKRLDLCKCSIDEGMFGINIHKAGTDSKLVDNWSAGCQVFKSSDDFSKFMEIVKLSSKIYGDKFTYTLLDEF